VRIVPDAPVRLAYRVRAIDARDGVELFARLREGSPLDAPAIPRATQLVVATRDLRLRRPVTVDDVTLRIVATLSTPTTFARLADRFGREALERRFSFLCLLDAVVYAGRYCVRQEFNAKPPGRAPVIPSASIASRSPS
jgi:hypothetical protein